MRKDEVFNANLAIDPFCWEYTVFRTIAFEYEDVISSTKSVNKCAGIDFL
jgi:hypothetical protein